MRHQSAPPLDGFARNSTLGGGGAIFQTLPRRIKLRRNLTITGTLYGDVRIEFLGGCQISCVSLIFDWPQRLFSVLTTVGLYTQHVFVLSRVPHKRQTLGDTQGMSGATTALIGCLHAVCIDFHTSSSVRPSPSHVPSKSRTSNSASCSTQQLGFH